MARPISSRTLFLTTSPRTPEKMIPEISLLVEHFAGCRWNTVTQRYFMDKLREEDFFHGRGEADPALSARDRVNRAPKSLGFVRLSPNISLTSAGSALLSSSRKEEVLLRQLLKFQIPSPYHRPTSKAASFCVKPYLEMLRLVRTLGTLRFDELQLFGMQLTDWHRFPDIIRKIERFRVEKTEHVGSYQLFKAACLRRELTHLFHERITEGATRTRESQDASLEKFLRTQANNMRDYADACFRYLRATGLVNVSHVGKSLSIVKERIEDVDYILNTIDRNPCFVEQEEKYLAYLGNADLPELLTDDRQHLMKRIRDEFPLATFNQTTETGVLKDMYAGLLERRKYAAIDKQVTAIKDYRLYDAIQETYEQIGKKQLYDAPLMLEWNTWRAMTMLDGGEVKANLKFDDFGQPLAPAQGNMADIVCDYKDFLLMVEVTMAGGQKQYEMEGEPVSRHLGRLKKDTGLPCYCLFVAPSVNEACVAHFYALHRMNISYYGGQSVIVPLPLHIFRKMLEDSYKAAYVPDAAQLKSFFDYSASVAANSDNETDWYRLVCSKALNWLQA